MEKEKEVIVRYEIVSLKRKVNVELAWRICTSGVAQKYGYISKMIFRLFNGHIRGYKRTEIYVQHH